MLGTVRLSYNDLATGEETTEAFDDVASVDVVGYPEGEGSSLIVQHEGEKNPNSVRDGIAFKSIE